MATYTKSPTIRGSVKNDALTGTNGDDVIAGGRGNDTLTGGNGNDVYMVSGAADGFDLYVDGGSTGYDVIAAGTKNTRIGLLDFGSWSGIEEINGNGYTGVTIGAQGAVRWDFSLTKLVGIDQITGSGGNDAITGSAGADRIVAGLGNDIVNGGGGNDTLAGGGGNDTIDGGADSDTVVLAGNYADYQIKLLGSGGFTFQGLANGALADGTDTVLNTETFQFADRTVTAAELVAAFGDTTASTPGLTVSGASGAEDSAIALNIAAALADLDGSESLGIVIGGVPAGAMLSAGTNLGNGNWSLTAAQLSGLKITPPANSDADFTLTVTATATEANGGATASRTANLLVAVAAVADAPSLAVADAAGTEGDTIALDLASSLVDLDGSEALSLVIGGLPAGASLTAGTDLGNGSWRLSADQVAAGVSLVTVKGGAREFALSIVATATEASGPSASTSASLTVRLEAAPAPAPEPTPTPAPAPVPGLTITGTSAADNLVGGNGNDTLDGKAGADTMAGGLGDDTYYLDNDLDKVIEAADAGIDTVIRNGSIRLADNVENAVMTGTWGSTGTGNASNNRIEGNSGANTIYGLDGDDTLVGGGGDDKLYGGNGVDTAVYTGKFADYQVTQVSNGGWNVTSLLTGEGKDYVEGIEKLQFADQTVTLTASTSSGGTGGGSTPTPTSPTSTAILKAPTVVQAQQPNDVVGLRLENNSAQAEGAHNITFGQVFETGRLLPGTALVAKIGGVEYAVQMDVKATHADGSVRHAVLTLDAPGIAAGGALDVMLATKATGASGQPITASDILARGLDVKVDFAFLNADGSKTSVTVDAASVLQKAIADGTVKTWLSGPLAGEFRVETEVNDIRTVFDIRMTKDGNIRTDVIFSNDNTFTAAQTVTYDVAIREGGATVMSEAGLAHYRNSMWHQEVWSEGAPPTHVVFDVNYLNRTGAVPTYDLSIGVTENSILNLLSRLTADNTGPLDSALIQKAMPMAGGRLDIGVTTTWTANYLVTQDERAYAVMMENADAAGAVPWHFRDEKTGEAVRVDLNPNLWLDPRATGTGQLATTYDTASYGWKLDNAHQPQLSYIPYLISGAQYHLDNMLYQASFVLGYTWNLTRQYGEGLLDTSETRAQAWAIRALADAAYAAPDGTALKAYFTDMLSSNLQHFHQKYVVGDYTQAGEVSGWWNGYSGDGKTAPWMQDYWSLTLNFVAQRGFTLAEDLLEWQTNFTAGRFINGDNGYDPMLGTAYYIKVFNHYSSGTPYFDAGLETSLTTWQQVYDANFTGVDLTTQGLYQKNFNPDHYAAIAKGALASAISGTGSADAIEAYAWLIGHTVPLATNFANDPHWNIAPQMADGSFMTYDKTRVLANAQGDVMAGTAGNELLYGNVGSDRIDGAAGNDWLHGDLGNDTVTGGAGNDHVFGGGGNDRLQGGTGNDYLKGNAGTDTFVFTESGSGKDVVADFRPGEDKIEVAAAINGQSMTAAKLAASVVSDASGNAVVQLGSGNEIVLLGVNAASISAMDFNVV